MTFTILGTGSELGSDVVTNSQISEQLGTTGEWLVARTGIFERRQASGNERTSTLAIAASRRALEMAGTDPAELDAIVCSTITPDHPQLPSTGCLIQAELGASRAFAFDVAAACSGFLFGLEIGAGFIGSKRCSKVLVIGAELMTRITDGTDLPTTALFADGAGAAVLSAANGKSGLLASDAGSDGSCWDYIAITAGGSNRPACHETVAERGHFMKMRGQELFRMAVRKMSEASRNVLSKANVDLSDLKLIIPHQANSRITDALIKDLGIERDRVFSNISHIGNTSAASVPIALDQCVRSGRIERGDLVLLTAFGGGVTWGATLLRW